MSQTDFEDGRFVRQEDIKINNATQNNLKNISLTIPKNKIIAVTGVSGSGKSSLVLDTIAAQSRRELNDTFPSFAQRYLPGYKRPDVSSIENLPVAIVIDQKKPGNSSTRSTVGTYTDMYSLLRLLFSRVGRPFVGYSDAFSFNHPQGKCERCDGLGEIIELDVHRLVDFDKCLNDPGVIDYVAYEPGQWRWKHYGASGLFDNNKKIKDYTKEELDLFLYAEPMKLKNPPKEWYKTAKYEGLMYRMNRMLKRADAKTHWARLEPLVDQGVCPECHGQRLNKKILSCKIAGYNISDVTSLPLTQLLAWVEAIDDPVAVDIKEALTSRLEAMCKIGLSYLTLDRPMNTLSGGETQRCKIAKYNNTSLTDLLYILDEPSVGLHAHDIHLLSEAIEELRDRGNTVLMVEHHEQMINIADHIIDMGPVAGDKGGYVQFEGSYDDFSECDTLTARLLRKKCDFKEELRSPKDFFEIKDAHTHNLKGFDVKVPLGVMVGVAGVAGSGKSSLMSEFIRQFDDDVIYIGQGDIGASLRSTPGTYTKAADDIRNLFAKHTHTKSSLFSFNSKGACPVCGGKGVIVSEMSFMEDVETVCEACGGLRYSDEALAYTFKGLNIAQVLDMSVSAAIEFFSNTDDLTKAQINLCESVVSKLTPLSEVGLSYLHLNQALSTLSGGELQRMKLASKKDGKASVYVIDEPTDGLHLSDIDHITELFDEMVDRGNSIFLIEHNLDVLKKCDWLVEVGPQGGVEGGKLLFSGVPRDILNVEDSVTAKYLNK